MGRSLKTKQLIFWFVVAMEMSINGIESNMHRAPKRYV